MNADKQLTPHFSLLEFVQSGTASHLGIDNTPPDEVVQRLQLTAEMLERIRSTLDAPMVVSSGYRCRALNQAVGGVSSSDHTTGQAADFVCPRAGSPYEIAKRLAPLVSVLGIGQLIYEHMGSRAWVHVSTRIPEKPANRVITISDAGVQLGIQEV